jgi:hypothetical protein
VADRLGLRLRISVEQRIDGAEQVGEHKTSMLQDVEAGRPLEVEPLIGAFHRARAPHRNAHARHRIRYALVTLLDARIRRRSVNPDGGQATAGADAAGPRPPPARGRQRRSRRLGRSAGAGT